MASTLGFICTAADIELTIALALLQDEVQESARLPVTASYYGQSLCVVTRNRGNWPFAVGRRKPNGAWMCYASRESANKCTHVDAARDTGTARGAVPGADAAGDHGGAVHGRSGSEGNRRIRRRTQEQTGYSTLPRPLVLSPTAQARHAAVIAAAQAASVFIVRVGHICPSGYPRAEADAVRQEEGDIEFGTTVAKMVIESWWCTMCFRTVAADGLDEGLIMMSQYTSYTEVFLFEAATVVCMNGANIGSARGLRECFHQMSVPHLFPRSQKPLRTLPVFRAAVMTYLDLVIEVLPQPLSTCSKWRRPDGSVRAIFFDSLQMCYRTRFATGFTRASVR